MKSKAEIRAGHYDTKSNLSDAVVGKISVVAG
jgi:hypothetical protein